MILDHCVQEIVRMGDGLAALTAATAAVAAVKATRKEAEVDRLLRYFEYEHLPAALQAVSRPLGELARQMAESLPPGPETTAGLRKLLEAKDCFVRAALPAAPPAASGGEAQTSVEAAPRSAEGSDISDPIEEKGSLRGPWVE